jgi:uroporphyrinogen-III synthase
MRRLGLTTTRDRGLGLAGTVAALGLDPVIVPCIEVTAASEAVIGAARLEAERSDWLILTSPRTVGLLWPGMAMPETNVAVVGQPTAQAVRDAGGRVAVVGDGGATELAQRISPKTSGLSVFFPHAAGADSTTIDVLEDSGATVRTSVVYDTRSIAPPDDAVDAVVFASPSAVTGWFISRDVEGVATGVIGETTAAELAGRGHTYDVVAPHPSMDELIRLIARHLRERSSV